MKNKMAAQAFFLILSAFFYLLVLVTRILNLFIDGMYNRAGVARDNDSPIFVTRGVKYSNGS